MSKRLHSDYTQSFYGILLHTIQIPGLTPALKLCSRDGRQFATLTLSDAEGVKWEITPTQWRSRVPKQHKLYAGATWKISSIQKMTAIQGSEDEIPSALRLSRRRTDGCKGWYDPGEGAAGTVESMRDLFLWIGDREQEEWETRIVAYSTSSLEPGEIYP